MVQSTLSILFERLSVFFLVADSQRDGMFRNSVHFFQPPEKPASEPAKQIKTSFVHSKVPRH